MKTPHRRFVIEVKSGRRQPKTRVNSIWGDTDLKALAREVEDKTPHLFATAKDAFAASPDTAKDNTLVDPLNKGLTEATVDLDIVGAVMPTVSNEIERQEAREAALPKVGVVEQVRRENSIISPPRTSRNTTRNRVKRAPIRVPGNGDANTSGDLGTRSKLGMEVILLDELIALDVENKRLKRLLAEQLRVQNLQLKKMLERFDIP